MKISNDCDLDYRQSKNKRLLVELALIRLCQLTDEKKKLIIADETPQTIQKIAVSQPASTPNPEVKVVSVATPVAAPVLKPKEQTATPKPAFQRPESISISANSLLNSPQETYSESETKPNLIENKPFTADELQKAWYDFATTIHEQSRMASFFMNTPTLIFQTQTLKLP